MRPIDLCQIKSSRHLSVKHLWVQQLIDHNFQCDDARMARQANGFLNPHWPHKLSDPKLPQLIAQAYQIWWLQHITHTPPVTDLFPSSAPDSHAYHRAERWRIPTLTLSSSASHKLGNRHLGAYLIQQPLQMQKPLPAT